MVASCCKSPHTGCMKQMKEVNKCQQKRHENGEDESGGTIHHLQGMHHMTIRSEIRFDPETRTYSTFLQINKRF